MPTPHSPKQDFWIRRRVSQHYHITHDTYHATNLNLAANLYLFPCSLLCSMANPCLPVMLHFRPGPSTPPLRSGQKYKMSSSLHFDAVVKFLRKKLALQPHESVFCYVNQVFAPGLDEGVGNLWRCFKTGDELVISYCVAQSFG